MSQENVEKVRAYLATWDRVVARPESWSPERINSTEVATALFAPDVVYEGGGDAGLPDQVGVSYRGLDGCARAARIWLEPFEWVLMELEEIIDADDHVVSLHRARGRMRYTEIEFEGPVAYVFTFRDGKVVHWWGFGDRAEALKAAGLEA